MTVEATEPVSRVYRFGLVQVDVFPELVTISTAYAARWEDFCEASLFVHRYTHGSDAALVVTDDELEVEVRTYPNIENLIGGGPYLLPGTDPRMAEAPLGRRFAIGPALRRISLDAATYTEQYTQELAVRSLVRNGALLAQAIAPHLLHHL